MAGGIRIAFGQFRELTEEDLLLARQPDAIRALGEGGFLNRLESYRQATPCCRNGKVI
jgi:hypothetical protein